MRQLMFVLLLLAPVAAWAQPTQFRDPQGRATARAVTRGTTTSFDPQNRPSGRVELRGGDAVRYDPQNRVIGRIEIRGGTARYRDAQGRDQGSAQGPAALTGPR